MRSLKYFPYRTFASFSCGTLSKEKKKFSQRERISHSSKVCFLVWGFFALLKCLYPTYLQFLSSFALASLRHYSTTRKTWTNKILIFLLFLFLKYEKTNFFSLSLPPKKNWDTQNKSSLPFDRRKSVYKSSKQTWRGHGREFHQKEIKLIARKKKLLKLHWAHNVKDLHEFYSHPDVFVPFPSPVCKCQSLNSSERDSSIAFVD